MRSLIPTIAVLGVACGGSAGGEDGGAGPGDAFAWPDGLAPSDAAEPPDGSSDAGLVHHSVITIGASQEAYLYALIGSVWMELLGTSGGDDFGPWSYASDLADWDGDGDDDLAISSIFHPVRIYRNENEWRPYRLEWSATLMSKSRAVEWGDLDGDGDQDLAVGSEDDPSVAVYRNDAQAMTLMWTATEADQIYDLDWADVDGDGDLDLATAARTATSRVYENVGGTFQLFWSSPEGDHSRSVAWGDVDGDGDPDLAFGNDSGGAAATEPVRVYRNDGGGFSLLWSSPEVGYTTVVRWVDYNGDGRFDLNAPNTGQAGRIYRNTAAGDLVVTWFTPQADNTTDADWHDFDGDGDQDLAISAQGCARIYRRGASLAQVWASENCSITTHSVHWSDIDDDGLVDLHFGNRYSWNLGTEWTTELLSPWKTSVESGISGSMAVCDFESDGDLDVVLGGNPVQALRQQGGGNHGYRRSWESSRAGRPDLTDIDGDGDCDLTIENDVMQVRLNEAGRFVPFWEHTLTVTSIGGPAGVAWSDIDGDFDLDLGLQTELATMVFENTGATLTPYWSDPVITGPDAIGSSVAWADVDGDDLPDLATADRVYRNTGAGFQLYWPPSDLEPDYSAVNFLDADGDDEPDLFLAGVGVCTVFRNTGTGFEALWSCPPVAFVRDAAVGLYDGDELSDLLIGDSSGPPRLFVNQGSSFAEVVLSDLPDSTSVSWLEMP